MEEIALLSPAFFLQTGKMITGSLSGKRVCALVFIGADCQERFLPFLGKATSGLYSLKHSVQQILGSTSCVKAKLTVQITIVVSGEKILSIRNYIMSLWVAPQSVTLHQDSCLS